MKLTRLQIIAIVVGIVLIGAHVAAPIVGASSAAPSIRKVVDNVGKVITKVLKHGEITAAHKNIEKAIQEFKEQPLKYGISAVVVGLDATAGISFVVDIVDKYGVSTAYDVNHKPNDDYQRLDIYVDGEISGAIAYENLANLEKDEVNTIIKVCVDAAIDEYQVRHKSGT